VNVVIRYRRRQDFTVPCMMRPAPSGVKASGSRRLLRADEAHVEALLEHGLVVHAAELIAGRIVRERIVLPG
jgi:hypothetical protein